jgi:hypothetical protein
MTIDRARLYWGVFFIVLGGVPLAYNQGAVAMDTVEELWRFWPVVLIGIGLAIVLSRTPGAIIGGLVVAACLGLVLGSLLAVGPEIGCGPNKGPSHSFVRYGTFDDSNPSVHLDLQCGTAQVTAASDDRWQIDASIRGEDPDVIATSNSLTIRQGDRHGWFFNRSYDLWDVSLPSGMGSLSASVDAGEATFNLAGATIPNATFSLNAGSMTVDLSAAKPDGRLERRLDRPDSRRGLEHQRQDQQQRRLDRDLRAEQPGAANPLHEQPGIRELLRRRPGVCQRRLGNARLRHRDLQSGSDDRQQRR